MISPFIGTLIVMFLALALVGFINLLLYCFSSGRPRIYWLILLLRIVGDRKSADKFVRHLKMIDRANASPQYNFDGINNPKKYISDMPKFFYKEVADPDYYMTKRIRVELHIYYCINAQGKFVATADYGKHWYLTGEDDAEWKKEVSYEKITKRVVRRDRMLRR